MPAHWLTEAESVRFTRYPVEIPAGDVVTFCTLTESDGRRLAGLRGDDSRLGCALQLCTLRYLGCVPAELSQAPKPVVGFRARQLAGSPSVFASYRERSQTRTDHWQKIEPHFGFHQASPPEQAEIACWLRERAMEHDRPLLVLQLLCERLHAQKMGRPGRTWLERSVATARQRAQTVTWELMAPRLRAPARSRRECLLVVDKARGLTPWTRFRTGATSPSAGAIVNVREKIAELRGTGRTGRELTGLNPNRLQLLARLGRRATTQARERMAPERR